MNNYEEVSRMVPGTIFRFNDGAPWLRTLNGVKDLIPELVELSSGEIPISWADNSYTVTVLYDPTDQEGSEGHATVYDIPYGE